MQIRGCQEIDNPFLYQSRPMPSVSGDGKTAVVGIISQFIQERGQILFVQRYRTRYTGIQELISAAAFGKRLSEQVHKG